MNTDGHGFGQGRDAVGAVRDEMAVAERGLTRRTVGGGWVGTGDRGQERAQAEGTLLNIDEHGSGQAMRHGEITDRVIRVFYDVYNELGYGFLEAVY